MKPTSNRNRNRVVVIGGSMAGLLATRVLADHYEQVILVERDNFPPPGEQRRGVPQGRHTHGLLASGRQVLDRLFPGISDQLTQNGAVEGDIVRDSRWFMEGACLSRPESGLNGLLMSRPLLEGAVRTRVLSLPNVTTRQNCDVEGLAATPDNRCVTGVKTDGQVVPADLVVDASGRGSHAP
jgi:2-polyprenyl-6-methoxyphenol hydroxylase-like FAD-dependent oxidoreductase